MKENRRKTDQYLLPVVKSPVTAGNYDIYPTHKIGNDEISIGIESLIDEVVLHKNVIIDGYTGVFFDRLANDLENSLKRRGKKTSWIKTDSFLKSHDDIEEIVTPFLGGDDPVFGTRTSLRLEDFFDLPKLKNISPEAGPEINFIIGPGASLSNYKGLVIYADLPKNEIQFRSRAGSITNLGASSPSNPKEMYKRFYFVDWIVLNRHKQQLLPSINIIVDAQDPDGYRWMPGINFRKALTEMSMNAFRVRPWFEPGVWGGSWIKEHIEGLNKDVANYAWSFEMIVPENGLLLESSGRMMEVSFDFLMYNSAESILGDCYERFGTDFPVRFDFLDTFDGGNLSVQCHPRQEYMKKNFGENFTQEETYYILDTKNNAVVYLGFQNDINEAEFRNALEESIAEAKPVDMEKFVQAHRASKHDLFLIPAGTVHGSGMNNLVLEISSTPYIFTFKMYDWLRPDLDGRPRPLNIKRAMDNLYFDRKGRYVKENLISRPVLLQETENYRLYHLPTHETQLYDVHRYHFHGSIRIDTGNKCHVLSLVEGTSVLVNTSGSECRFSYAETFVIPAAAGSYEVINESNKEAILIKAFVK